MPVVKEKIKNSKYNDVISYNMRDYSKEPYFIKKSEDAIAFLEKHPIPDWILRAKRKQ